MRRDIRASILEHFFLEPNSRLRVREIERLLGLPLPSVIRYCRELVDEGLLRIDRIGSVCFHTSSGSAAYRLEKRLFNIRRLHSSGLVEYLRSGLSNPVIILFGSYSRGEDVEGSDIDLYVESSPKGLDLSRFEKALKRRIQLFMHRDIRKISNPHLANNIINGITLNNAVEVFR